MLSPNRLLGLLKGIAGQHGYLSCPKKSSSAVAVRCGSSSGMKCPAGSVSGRDYFNEGKFSIAVNGVLAANLTKLHECDVLTNPDGFLWKPNEDGRFEIKVKVLEPDSFIRISAFIIW